MIEGTTHRLDQIDWIFEVLNVFEQDLPLYRAKEIPIF